MSEERKIIESTQRLIRSHYLLHPMSCEYPEGCSCGASFHNHKMKHLIDQLEKVKEKV